MGKGNTFLMGRRGEPIGRVRVVPLRTAKKQCIIQDCRREGYARGVCKQCYAKARYLIKQGIETERSLVERGLLLPSKRFIKQTVDRIKEAIIRIHERGEYPSGAKINLELKRRTYSLRNDEYAIRTQIFQELGIKKRRGFSE